MRTTILAALVALPVAAAAQEAPAPSGRVALPLQPPADAAPLLSDFLAVCSRAVVNLGAGITEAQGRGYALAGDMPGLMAAAVGFGALDKDVDGGNAFLSLNRLDFPHLTAFNCSLTVSVEGLVLDTAPIGTIGGIEGGGVAIAGARLGRWSLLDADGEVVTIVDTQAGSRMRLLTMARALRTPLAAAAAAP